MPSLLLVLAMLAVTLSACTPVPQPVIDMTGVDPGVYSRDLAACYTGGPAISLGNPLANCMRAKGYKILVAN